MGVFINVLLRFGKSFPAGVFFVERILDEDWTF
jgi:hypothetical protein